MIAELLHQVVMIMDMFGRFWVQMGLYLRLPLHVSVFAYHLTLAFLKTCCCLLLVSSQPLLFDKLQRYHQGT